MRPNMERLAELAERHPKDFNRQQIAQWRGGCGANIETVARVATLEGLTPEQAGRAFFVEDDRTGTECNAAEEKTALSPPKIAQEPRSFSGRGFPREKNRIHE